ncbi:MAG: hypothetical protein AB8B91_17180 [Rubripirellula sp.]
MEIIDIISRILHVGTAITLVGGSVFTAFVLMPSAKELNQAAHDQLAAAVQSKWKRFVHPGVLLFLLSGFYNYFRAIPLHKGDGLYHALIGTKMLLALVVFFIAAALVGRSAKLEPIRQQKAKWIKILVLLAAIIVTISGFVKVRGVPVKPQVQESVEPNATTWNQVGDELAMEVRA